MPKPLTAHRIKHWMLRDRITIVVVGCGGTGAALISGLPIFIMRCWQLAIPPESRLA